MDESVHLSVSILDRYLHRHVQDVTRDRAQVVGAAALMLAAKAAQRDDADEVLEPAHLVASGGGAFTRTRLLEEETDMALALNYDLFRPTACTFLFQSFTRWRREREASGGVTDNAWTCFVARARTLCELCLLDSRTQSTFAPSTVATSAATVAARTLGWSTLAASASIRACVSSIRRFARTDSPMRRERVPHVHKRWEIVAVGGDACQTSASLIDLLLLELRRSTGSTGGGDDDDELGGVEVVDDDGWRLIPAPCTRQRQQQQHPPSRARGHVRKRNEASPVDSDTHLPKRRINLNRVRAADC